MKKRILTLGIAAAMIFGSFNTPVFFERTEVLAEENSGGGQPNNLNRRLSCRAYN